MGAKIDYKEAAQTVDEHYSYNYGRPFLDIAAIVGQFSKDNDRIGLSWVSRQLVNLAIVTGKAAGLDIKEKTH
ncbi:hypothetical protein D3OALGA1CA_5712 [Olavius algarvensis associated proteobacterium Delta 3]|nr:hypothetical protein D3OALGB2SA_2465 [Olavius algarvensis associated proteobacterium Delta 3]CAB5170692.1 hypothetical protein D3OALGA1CA_5712 [Olavius algarvensis associated proteobacterium Delta 3]